LTLKGSQNAYIFKNFYTLTRGIATSYEHQEKRSDGLNSTALVLIKLISLSGGGEIFRVEQEDFLFLSRWWGLVLSCAIRGRQTALFEDANLGGAN
jgi:hypothetical protein